MADSEAPPLPTQRHTLMEDLHAFGTGASFAAVGVVLLRSAGLITGGVAGLALELSYWTHWPVGPVFLVLNLPFFAIAQRRLGWQYTLRSLTVVTVMSLLTVGIPHWLNVQAVNPVFAALFGGTLIGMGVLALVRHRASVGGIGLLALYLNETRGINAGKVQLVADLAILMLGFFLVPLKLFLLSLVSAASLSLVVIAYHRPGRYTGY
jgi:uncharacterized membrane-anchored protein YitT (DUF2179 family)